MRIPPPLALTQADAVPMGCTTWLAMFGNGWRIRMMPRIIRPPLYQIHWDLIWMISACYGVVRGATPWSPRVPRHGIHIFITTTPTMSTVALAFVAPGMRPNNKRSTAGILSPAVFSRIIALHTKTGRI